MNDSSLVKSCDNTIDSNQTVNTSYLSSNEYHNANLQHQQLHHHQPPASQHQHMSSQNSMQKYPYQSDYTPMKLWNSTYPQQNWQNKPNPFQPLKESQEVFDADNIFFDHKSNEKRSALQYNAASNKYMKNSMLNAPSYVPYRYPSTPNSTVGGNKVEDDKGTDLKEEVQKLKNELILKNQMIKNLTDQISIMIKNKNSKAYYEVKEDGGSNHSPTFKLPQNHFQLFQDLSKTLQEKCQELDDANQRMEIILVSSHICNNGSSNAVGYDVEELSHKLLYKMNQLQAENDELVKMVSLSNKSSLLVEIGLLKQQITSLTKKDGKQEE
ncbi:MUM2 [Candida margitis]|uniref:MUM2 n=1 Tax=Candida margitis TaxID=1775924 RepID=UPI00222808EB|nr:MUM2 [Candida margitis]KAI5958441.1 MUM2 [Candida margitis]